MSKTFVDWNEAALTDMLNSVQGPVGMFINELSVKAAVIAIYLVHVRPGTASSATTGLTSDARAPGFTKSRIRPQIGYNKKGRLYGGVRGPADPSIFLEKPAEQQHDKYPFLTTSVWSLEGTF